MLQYNVAYMCVDTPLKGQGKGCADWQLILWTKVSRSRVHTRLQNNSLRNKQIQFQIRSVLFRYRPPQNPSHPQCLLWIKHCVMRLDIRILTFGKSLSMVFGSDQKPKNTRVIASEYKKEYKTAYTDNLNIYPQFIMQSGRLGLTSYSKSVVQYHLTLGQEALITVLEAAPAGPATNNNGNCRLSQFV